MFLSKKNWPATATRASVSAVVGMPPCPARRVPTTLNTATVILASVILLFSAGCTRPTPGLARVKTIAIQPIGQYNSQQLPFIRKEISSFFNRPVIILPPIGMPASFLNRSKGKRYSADSIISFLSARKGDTLSEIVGYTSLDIYTNIRDSTGQVKEPRLKYGVWGIMGLGFCPGTACIVSDRRLKTNDPKKFEHRLRTLFLHEIGHNLGLPHCLNAHCIMQDVRGKVSTIDSSFNDYCTACRQNILL